MEGELLMLGDLLRQTREQKNLTLEDVEKGTNIRKLYLKAIEDGNYDRLPGEVFLKGFIKTYGRFLGLKGQDLIQQYKEEKNGVPKEQEALQSIAQNTTQNIVQNTEVAPTEAKKETKEIVEEKKVEQVKKEPVKASKPNTNTNIPKIGGFDAEQQYLKPQSSGNKRNIILLLILIVAIIGGAVLYLSLSQSSSDPKTSAPAPAVQQEQPVPPPVQQQQQPAVVSGSDVTAVFSQDCWTEVKVDGNVVLSETVPAGKTLNWKGNNQIEITVGNAGAAEITFNGQSIGKLGDVGAVVTRSFPETAPADQNNTAPPATENQQQQAVQQ